MNKKILTASIIKDGDLLATLEKARAEFNELNKGKETKGGDWALLTAEDPEGDEEGDIIEVAGIVSDIDPANDTYLPILPSHMKKLENGSAPTIGRIEMLQDCVAKGMKAKAMYFSWALDEKGEPIDDLVGGYYKRYKRGYLNSFSVGMDPLEQPTRIGTTGGWRYPKTKLYEVSCVAIGANRHAIGLTRSKEEEDELMKAVGELKCNLTSDTTQFRKDLEAAQKRVEEFYKMVEDRMDAIESALVARPQPEPVTKAKDDSTSEYIAELKRIAEKIKLP